MHLLTASCFDSDHGFVIILLHIQIMIFLLHNLTTTMRFFCLKEKREGEERGKEIEIFD